MTKYMFLNVKVFQSFTHDKLYRNIILKLSLRVKIYLYQEERDYFGLVIILPVLSTCQNKHLSAARNVPLLLHENSVPVKSASILDVSSAPLCLKRTKHFSIVYYWEKFFKIMR